MLVSRVLEVRNGDTAAAVCGFLGRLLSEGVAERLFLPVASAEGLEARSQVVTGAEALSSINPLPIVMLENGAVALRQAMEAEPEAHFVALLRPCELRAVVELAKRGRFDLERLAIVGMDCLSTYEVEFVRQSRERHPADLDALLKESLRLAQTGQIAGGGYRMACQLCDRPSADYRAANVLLGLVGVNTGEKVLVLADDRNDTRFKLQRLTDREATEREAVDREVTLWRLSERRKEAAQRKLEALGLADAYPGVIMGYMRHCTLCGDCVAACPQCSDELRLALGRGKEAFIAALLNESLRLASCAGCGMCQVNCPEGIPLGAISRALSDQIQIRMHYVPGRDVAEPLPWAL